MSQTRTPDCTPDWTPGIAKGLFIEGNTHRTASHGAHASTAPGAQNSPGAYVDLPSSLFMFGGKNQGTPVLTYTHTHPTETVVWYVLVFTTSKRSKQQAPPAPASAMPLDGGCLK